MSLRTAQAANLRICARQHTAFPPARRRRRLSPPPSRRPAQALLAAPGCLSLSPALPPSTQGATGARAGRLSAARVQPGKRSAGARPSGAACGRLQGTCGAAAGRAAHKVAACRAGRQPVGLETCERRGDGALPACPPAGSSSRPTHSLPPSSRPHCPLSLPLSWSACPIAWASSLVDTCSHACLCLHTALCR